MRYSVHFDNVATGAVADTYKTMLAILSADTAGYRARLRKLAVGPADDTPLDLNISLVLERVDSVSGGGAGTGDAVTPVKLDADSRAAVITAKSGCSAEPTVYGTPLWACGLNRRNSIVEEWSPEDAPIIEKNQLLGLLAAPRTAAAAVLTGYMEFEEF